MKLSITIVIVSLMFHSFLTVSMVPVPGQINDIQLQSNGYIVASGYNNSQAQLVRYTPTGDLDTTFGDLGVVQFQGTNTKIFDSVLQSDQKIIVVGSAINTTYDLFIARLLTDGSLDASFGNGGIVQALIGQNATAYSVGLQSDGKIVVSGTTTINGVFNGFVTRYTTAGVLDTSFGNNGLVTINQAQGVSLFSLLILQSNDAFLVAGFETVNNQNQLLCARFFSNGTLDTSFGTSGYRVAAIGSNDNVQKIISSNDGAYLLTGSTISAGQFVSMTVKLNSSGNFVSNFGSSGVVITNLVSESYSYGALVQPDSKIVIAGGSVNQSNPAQSTVIRYTSSGALDTLFGNQGAATTSAPLSNQANTAFLQPDGNIVVAGSIIVGSSPFNMIARFTTDGQLDTSFGVNGIVGISNVSSGAGSTGFTGATGPQGIQGSTGNTGPQGLQGAQGFTGATGTFASPQGYISNYRTANIVLPNNAWQGLLIPTPGLTPNGWTVATVGGNTEFTCTLDGLYEITYWMNILGGTAGVTTVSSQAVVDGAAYLTSTAVVTFIASPSDVVTVNLTKTFYIDSSVGTTFVIQARANRANCSVYQISTFNASAPAVTLLIRRVV